MLWRQKLLGFWSYASLSVYPYLFQVVSTKEWEALLLNLPGRHMYSYTSLSVSLGLDPEARQVQTKFGNMNGRRKLSTWWFPSPYELIHLKMRIWTCPISVTHVRPEGCVRGFRLRHLTLWSESNWIWKLNICFTGAHWNLVIWTLGPNLFVSLFNFVRIAHVRFERYS